MSIKIIAFPIPKHSAPVSTNPDSVDFTCSVISLDFASGRSIAELSQEWQLEESIITDILRAQIDRTCPMEDRRRYQLAEC
jgi:hypothetical protein